MPRETVVASVEAARRLAVSKQRLAGPLPDRVSPREIVSVVRDIAYLQWDPISIVAPNHLLSLWSRVGPFPPSLLERMLWGDKTLFEHWCPMASLVLTEDYPLYYSLMRRYPASLSHSWANHREKAKRFLAEHPALRRNILFELKGGPLSLGDFRDHLRTKRHAPQWEFTSDVSLMLYHLTMSGDVMVVGHRGGQNLWGLSSQFLPDRAKKVPLSEAEFERLAAIRALRALGTATSTEITFYFVRGRYENLTRTLGLLEKEGTVHRVTVKEFGPRDARYVLDEDLAKLSAMDSATWHPRLSLLPPFDNMVCSQTRTLRLFDFNYVREQFLPREKRRFGTYVLPILWGEKFIGRIDPRMDRASGTLRIGSVHAESDAPGGREVVDEIRAGIGRLATCIGAKRVSYSRQVPRAWRSLVRNPDAS